VKKVSLFSTLLGTVLALLTVHPVAAQSCSANPCSVNNTVTATVGTILKLTLSSTATALTPVVADYDLGHLDTPAALTASVKSNRAWNLSVAAATANWGASGGAWASKPAGDLYWTTDGISYFQLSTVAANVFGSLQSGVGGGANGPVVATFGYRSLWSYVNDTPGTYTMVVVYTVTAP
jgi:hypothetical protein